jgi:hypothetical protein
MKFLNPILFLLAATCVAATGASAQGALLLLLSWGRC